MYSSEVCQSIGKILYETLRISLKYGIFATKYNTDLSWNNNNCTVIRWSPDFWKHYRGNYLDVV